MRMTIALRVSKVAAATTRLGAPGWILGRQPYAVSHCRPVAA